MKQLFGRRLGISTVLIFLMIFNDFGHFPLCCFLFLRVSEINVTISQFWSSSFIANLLFNTPLLLDYISSIIRIYFLSWIDCGVIVVATQNIFYVPQFHKDKKNKQKASPLFCRIYLHLLANVKTLIFWRYSLIYVHSLKITTKRNRVNYRYCFTVDRVMQSGIS